MTDSASNFQITFREGVSERVRDLAERSVAALVSRGSESLTKLRGQRSLPR